MKANIKKSGSSSDKGGIILSIGMIVKNEERVLRRCLESLQPLMKAIPSELIIADTGSTDSTVEIAKEFTDNVFHFEWINDFAAARNSTLERAKGQWFLFVDADEYLDEDIGEMVHFFKIPELRSRYRTIELMVRNYTDKEKKHFQDGCLARFHRIDDPEDPVCFVGSVHEGIWIRYPLGYFTTILHHTGYCYSSEKQNIDKQNRNLVLMREEYKLHPDDLRILSHLIDGTTFEKEECEGYVTAALKNAKNHSKNLYRNVVYMQAMDFYKESNPEFALEIEKDYYSGLENPDHYIATIGILNIKADILCGLGRYSEAYDTYRKYFKLYKDYKEDKLDITDSSAHPILGLTDSEYERKVYSAALCLQKLKRFDEAFELIDQFDVEKIDEEHFRNHLATIRSLCQESKEYAKMAKYYSAIDKLESIDKKSLALYMMETAYYNNILEKDRKKYAEDIVKSGADGKYVDLMKLVISQDNDNFVDDLRKFFENVSDWNDGYSEAIYLAIKNKVDISEYVLNMKSDIFREKLEMIANNNDDFAGFVLDYGIPEGYFSSMKQFYWIVSLYEKASYRSFELSDEKKLKLYNKFISLLGDYVLNIYNPEIFNDGDLELLPAIHRFGYYMNNANYVLSLGDKKGYIRGMKKALINCESMREIVQFLLEQFKSRNLNK